MIPFSVLSRQMIQFRSDCVALAMIMLWFYNYITNSTCGSQTSAVHEKMTGSLGFLMVHVVAILIGCSLGYPLSTLTIGDLDIVVSTTKIKVTFCLLKLKPSF